MGKSSGSDRGGMGKDGGGNYSGSIKNPESLKNIKDRELQRELQQGVAKYESRLGIGTTNIMLADLEGAYGVHVTSGGKSEGIYLSKKHFKNASVDSVVKSKKSGYKTKFSTPTNKPVQHTLIHELGHATWNSALSSKSAVGASKSIRSMYKTFKKEKPRAYGSYAYSNVNEFWAETTAKAVLGKSDKYTRFVKSTIKKYKL